MLYGGEMILLPRPRKRFSVIKKVIIVFILLIIIAFLIIEFTLKPTIVAFAEAQARWTATKAIHSAILEEVSDNLTYKDIVHIEKDSEGRIIFMQPNIVKINKISSSATLEVQRTLENLKNNNFEIPLGQILGSKLLAHYGPGIKLILLPVGTVDVSPVDSFEEAGINQTRHRIYLDVKSDVKVVIPFISSKIDVKLQVPVVDAVIVGEVPETYVNLDFGGMSQGKAFTELEKLKPEALKELPAE